MQHSAMIWDNWETKLELFRSQVKEMVEEDSKTVFHLPSIDFAEAVLEPTLFSKMVRTRTERLLSQIDESLVGKKKLEKSLGKIRIGYIGKGITYDEHESSTFLMEMLKMQNRKEFEIFVYNEDLSQQNEGNARKQVAFYADHFRDVSFLHLISAVKLIQEDNLHFLITTELLEGRMTELLSHRLAPVQICYSSVPRSLGGKVVDLLATHPFLVEKTEHFTETLVSLPFFVPPKLSKYSLRVPQQITRAELGLPENVFSLIVWNDLSFFPQFLESLKEVLTRLPNVQLWLKRDPHYCVDPIKEKLGTLAERVSFIDPTRIASHNEIDIFPLADLAIDTFPISDRQQTINLLWSGVPVISMCGESPLSRVSCAILHSLKLEQLTVDSPSKLVEKVVEYVNDKKKLKAIKRKLDSEKHSPKSLFDSRHSVEQFENKLKEIYNSASDKSKDEL